MAPPKQPGSRQLARRENFLRLFWFLLSFALIAGAVALFESRDANRSLVISEKGTKLLNETVAAHPDTKDAMVELMLCIRKGSLKVDKGFDEDDMNRPRQVCPKYALALEALHPSPMGMHELELAYRHIVLGLKANL